MKLMLLIIPVLSLVLSGVCISNGKIKELLMRPVYEVREVSEVKEVTYEESEEDLLDIIETDGNPDEDVSNKDSVSVADILNY